MVWLQLPSPARQSWQFFPAFGLRPFIKHDHNSHHPQRGHQSFGFASSTTPACRTCASTICVRYASHAVMQGTPLPVVAKLLGHSQTTMTLRYAHTGDRETATAAERIGTTVSGMLGL